MKYENPRVPEHINADTKDSSPLKEFLILMAKIAGVIFAFTLLVYLTVPLWAKHIPFSWEKALMLGDIGMHSQDDAMQAKVSRISDQLYENMPFPEDITVDVQLIDGDVFNAFAAPGGVIVLYDEMLASLETEEELALLLAHEMSHVLHRDIMKAIASDLIVSLVLNTVIGGNVLGSVSNITALGFSRSREEEADNEGLKAVYAIYGNVNCALTLFEKLEAAQQFEMPEILSTHPDAQSRIDKLRDYAKEQGWRLDGNCTALEE